MDSLTKIKTSEVMNIIVLFDEQLAYRRKPLRHMDQILAIKSNTQGDNYQDTDETRPPEALTTAPRQEREALNALASSKGRRRRSPR